MENPQVPHDMLQITASPRSGCHTEVAVHLDRPGQPPPRKLADHAHHNLATIRMTNEHPRKELEVPQETQNIICKERQVTAPHCQSSGGLQMNDDQTMRAGQEALPAELWTVCGGPGRFAIRALSPWQRRSIDSTCHEGKLCKGTGG